MQSHDRSGIVCDLCGSNHRLDFAYYSMDARQVTVRNNRIVSDTGGPPVSSFDACTSCVELIKDAIRVNYRPTSSGVNCDLCDSRMRGDFMYYDIAISRVDVSAASGSISCARCGVPGPAPACRCGSDKFVRVAEVKVDENFLRLIACQRDYGQFTEAAMRIRKAIGEIALRRQV